MEAFGKNDDQWLDSPKGRTRIFWIFIFEETRQARHHLSHRHYKVSFLAASNAASPTLRSGVSLVECRVVCCCGSGFSSLLGSVSIFVRSFSWASCRANAFSKSGLKCHAPRYPLRRRCPRGDEDTFLLSRHHGVCGLCSVACPVWVCACMQDLADCTGHAVLLFAFCHDVDFATVA